MRRERRLWGKDKGVDKSRTVQGATASNRRLEASGIPVQADANDELAQLIARKLGIAPPVQHDHLPIPDRYIPTELGRNDLPVWDYKEEILNTVEENPISIFLAETGSGKSTQIPQYLIERGYEVILTQPRRIAAEMVSRRIAHEVTGKLGPNGFSLVGFQTAERSTITDETRVSVVTDGLQLARELGVFADGGRTSRQPRVIIIDEVHERNTNIDVLLAWAKKGLVEQSDTRVVITTAGINAQKVARHLSTRDFTPPILEIPGRSFEIKRIEQPNSDVIEQACLYAERGHNVLIFLPGIAEIEQTMNAVSRRLHGTKGRYEFLSLHGKMSYAEQQLVEREYPYPKIVFATNVAETSITIPDVDVVVDSGLERRIEIDEEGVEMLVVGTISKAGVQQRGGRCGRTHDGIYVSTRLNAKVPYIPISERVDFAKPEILRSNVDKTVLSIAAAGLDINDLDLLDKIDSRVIARAKNTLRVIGALDEDNNVTQRGRRMNQFPVRPTLSRMITYAEENGFTNELKQWVASMVASIESGGLPDHTAPRKAWKQLTSEQTSDLLAQMDIFITVQNVTDARFLSENDLNIRNIDRAKELYGKLISRMGLPNYAISSTPNPDEKEMLRECIVAGMIDYVYEKRGADYTRSTARLGKQTQQRDISDRSVVRGSPSIVVGMPYAISSPPDRDLPERHIVQDVTATTTELLAKTALSLCVWSPVGDEFVWRGGQAFVRSQRVFRGTIPTGEYREYPAEWSEDLGRAIVAYVLRKPGRNLSSILEAKRVAEDIQQRTGEKKVAIHNNQVDDMLATVSGLKKKAMRNKPMNPDLLDLALQPYVDKFWKLLPTIDVREKIMNEYPDFIDYQGLALQIRYSNGIPIVAKITDEMKKALKNTSGVLKLANDRDILIPHSIRGNTKYYKIEEFRTIRL